MFPKALVLFLFTFGFFTSGVKIVKLDIPSPANQGESTELTCSYELDNDRLYSIKWYKNDVEFYRYVPNDWPSGQFLPLPGVKVDISRSGRRSVYLQNIDLNSSGIYRCEVSAEGPNFQTVEAEKEMNVVVLPTEGPRISGGKSKYDVGNIVAINCTSAKSKPAATLRWYINDEPSVGEYETEYSTTLHADGLETSSLSLCFIVEQRHFKEQNMRLKCTATVSRLYSMSDEQHFVGGNQQTSQLQVNQDNEDIDTQSESLDDFEMTSDSISEINSDSSSDKNTFRRLSFCLVLLHPLLRV